MYQLLGDLGQGEEIAEDTGTQQDHRDHAAAVRGAAEGMQQGGAVQRAAESSDDEGAEGADRRGLGRRGNAGIADAGDKRSEEHTSELQSLMRISYAVFGFKNKKYK